MAKQRIIAITGASGGLAQEIVKQLSLSDGIILLGRDKDKLEKCYEYCKTVTDFIPRVGLILGSGLGGYAKNMKVVKEISYDQIPGFPVSTVQGHDGKFLLGYIGKVPAMERTRSFL